MRLLRLQQKVATQKALKNFTLVDTLKSPDLNLQITRLMHSNSGAMIYNLKSADKDNTFAPIVRTLPENSTGCPHILEHLACCGSERYPVRDPFFNMLRRSVNTFMNAWTGDDFTAYPFSSANQKDYDNLYKVYLDMCLKPLLNQLDFRQQGWRYQISEQGKKQIKGIVFNQMKGAYQNPDRQLYIQLASKLFENTPFGHDSGGKPQSIVKLSYQQVKNMHKYYYHPSNMSFYYYGNSDISEKLQYLQQQYLNKFQYKNNTSQYHNKSTTLLSQMPKSLSQTFHTVQSPTAQTPNLSLTYNLGLLSQINEVDLQALHILSYILLENNQAVLYREFIETGLADSFGMGGFSLGTVVSFGLGLKNLQCTSQQVVKIFQKSLNQIIKQGIDNKRLQEYTSQTQLDILTPKRIQGISYLSTLTPFMVNRLPLTTLANIRSNLNKAVSMLRSKQQLTKLINKYFLQNHRKICIRQQPIKNKAKDSDDGSSFVGLDMDDTIIKKQQKQLKERQENNKENSVQCLPKLNLEDLQTPIDHKFQVKKQGIIKLSQGRKGANFNIFKDIHIKIEIKSINFIRTVFTLDMQKQENQKILRFLDLWCYTIKQGIAVKGLTNKQLSSQLNRLVNNFSITLQKSANNTSINVIFYASCLDTNLHKYLQLLHKILHEPVYNQQDVQPIFRSYKTEKIEELLDGSVMQYCLDYGASRLKSNPTTKIFDKYMWATEGISIAGSGSIPQEFKDIHKALLNNSDVTILQHSQQFVEGTAQKLGFNINYQQNISRREQKNQIQNNNQPQPPKLSVTNSYQVNFCTQQYLSPQFLSKQHAQISLLIQILQQDYLHQKIRQKGGAYGAKAKYRDNGTIALYSYMDPNSGNTYRAFDQGIREILASQVDKSRLDEVKIKYIGGIDSPIVPQNQSVEQILRNFTNQQKNNFRQYIRAATWESIVKTGKKYLTGENIQISRVMFGKDVPEGFAEQKLKIPKQSTEENQGSQQQKGV